MTARDDLLLGQIALEKKFVTADQLQQVLADRAREARPRPLGVLLVARGFITEEQLAGLIDECRRRRGEPSDYAEVRREDLLFGRTLVREGRATSEQVDEALRRQQELAEAGTIERLSKILADHGTLSREVVGGTPERRRETLVACPSCGARFGVAGHGGGEAYALDTRGSKPEEEAGGTGGTAAVGPGRSSEPLQAVGGIPDDSPRRFGKYVLVKQVGTGGFGAVYKAYERELGRTVALKFFHSGDPEDLQRFTREARMVAKLSHPHIVPLYEVGEHEGKHYLAMQFIEGDTLKRLRLEPDQALRIMRDVAGAVQYAHEKGIIHRDLKPQNLMMGEDGHVWVMDFGLARHLRGGTTLTISGAVVGTPSYMPPEQAEGKRCDERSDVYALGATLYELLAGHPPFEGNDALAVLEKVRREEPVPPRQYNPKIPREAETIVLKCLEKDPAKRYASAAEFAEDLRRHLAGEPIRAKQAGAVTKGLKWVKRHRALSAVSGAAFAALMTFGIVEGVDAHRFHARIRDLESRGRAAEDSGRHAEAAELYGQIKMLVPGHPAVDRIAIVRAAERRAAALRYVADGRKAREDYEALKRRLDETRERARRLEEETPKPLPEKPALWNAQREADEAEEAAALRYIDMLVAYTLALGVDPDNAEARAALAMVYYEEYEEAERAGRSLDLKKAEKLALLFDRSTYEPKLLREGTIEIDSNPPGAEVELLRYGEGPDRRLEARPVRHLGACPIPTTRLGGGSYLLILRKHGHREVRYPVFIGRGTRHAARVNLYTEDEIGKEFVYVPGGPFLAGGDPAAYLAEPRRTETTGDVFIGKYEVSCSEYLEFLNDRSYQDAAQAFARTPRQTSVSGAYWRRDGDRIEMAAGWERWPVMGISRDDAEEYCVWRSKREGKKYRLPTSVEWEKAARGADGRFFPWGNHWDWSFTSGGESRILRPGERRQPDPVGLFPKDESPYGVRDLAGSMREWCRDWEDEVKGYARVRGGAWGFTDVSFFRTASRDWLARSLVSANVGFRVARAPEPR